LNDILQTGHTMHNIIQELMLLAQVNRAEVDLAPLSMLALIRSARYRLAQMSQEYQAEITLEAPERWPPSRLATAPGSRRSGSTI
jgi:light-regulated signal transduction histidine kinase (bacteriophytochrome)